MSVIDSARAQLQARPRTRTPAKPWRFPSVSDLLAGHKVLVFDGTLTNAGWSFIEVHGGRVHTLDKGTLRPKTDLTGYEETWAKALHLDRMLETSYIGSYARQAGSIVVEAPAVNGFRTESSLIASLVVMLRFRADGADISAVSAPHVSAVLLGDSRVVSAERKPRIRAAVVRFIPEAETGWNEHERDSAATGITHLYDLKRKQDEL